MRWTVLALWDETYDIVIPYGDKRDIFFESVRVFDLDVDVLILHKKDSSVFAPLAVLVKHELPLEDFSPLPPPRPYLATFQRRIGNCK